GRPELVVRARREVVRKTPQQEMDDLTTAALLAPRQVNELGMAAAIGTLTHEKRAVTVPVIVKLPLDKLTFLTTAAGYRGTFRVHYALLGEKADFTVTQSREQAIDVAAADMEKTHGRHF